MLKNTAGTAPSYNTTADDQPAKKKKCFQWNVNSSTTLSLFSKGVECKSKGTTIETSTKSDSCIEEEKENMKANTSGLPRGLSNESNTCYINSLIQVLFHDRLLRDLVFSLQPKSPSTESVEKLTVLEALQWLFVDLIQTPQGQPLTTTRLTRSLGWTSLHRGLQRDFHEFFMCLLSALEKEMDAELFANLSTHYTSIIIRRVECKKVSYLTERRENVHVHTVSTLSHTNLEDAIKGLFEKEDLQMTLEAHGQQEVEVSSVVEQSPKTLLIMLNRLKYDSAMEMVVKVPNQFSYPSLLTFAGQRYRLSAVVVHEGSADDGHYYCYVQPSDRPKQWFLFNDTEVRVTDERSAVRKNFGSRINGDSPTAYILSYQRLDSTDLQKFESSFVPKSIEGKINGFRELEAARLMQQKTAHLYMMVTVVDWTALVAHDSYDVYDRLKLMESNRSAGNFLPGITTYRVLKEETIAKVISQHDPNCNQESSRLWVFTERQSEDGACSFRPDKLIKSWEEPVLSVADSQNPFCMYLEKADGTDRHPKTLTAEHVSVFVKYYKSQRLSLVEHVVADINMSMSDFESLLKKLEKNLDTVRIYQELSCHTVESVEYKPMETIGSCLGSVVLRHATTVIVTCGLEEELHMPITDYMRNLGNVVHVTWYNKETTYQPSQTGGDFVMTSYLHNDIKDVLQNLSEQLHASKETLLVYPAKRDQGFPQVNENQSYSSSSDCHLLQLVQNQIKHYIWRHAVVLFYEALPMPSDEIELRNKVVCTYVSDDLSFTELYKFYPMKEENGQRCSISSVLCQAKQKLQNPQRLLRLLVTKHDRIVRLCQPDSLVDTIAGMELRLEAVPEDQETLECEFSAVLASVSNECLFLYKRGVPNLPFLITVHRRDTGIQIKQAICRKLRIKEAWQDKFVCKIIIPNVGSQHLSDVKLSAKDWTNLSFNEHTGSYEGSNYIRIEDT